MKPSVLFLNTDKQLISDLEEVSNEFQFINCETFDQAIHVIDETKISLVVVDTDIFQTAKIEEFDLFKSLVLYNDTGFIYLTDERNFLEHRVNANCIDVISKPVPPHKLIPRIQLVLTDQREKLIFQGYLDDYPIHDLIKISEQILFTGVILIEFNYERSKLIFENGRLERALLDLETDWTVMDYILSWKSGEFQIYGNIDSFSEIEFFQKKSVKKRRNTQIQKTKLVDVLKNIKLEIAELMGMAIIDQDANVIADNIIIEMINIENQRFALKTVIKQARLMLLALNSSHLNELSIVGDKHNIHLKQIGKRKIYFVSYVKKGASSGILQYVLKKFENTILTILDEE
jgi:predicted regulator of Ras-like GTPase activity (Roadblock/LC7/MglB family)/DNA-binding response OmpR family regulator